MELALDTYFAVVTANTTRGPRIRSINHARAAVTFRLQEIYEQLHALPPPHTPTAGMSYLSSTPVFKRYPLATLQTLYPLSLVSSAHSPHRRLKLLARTTRNDDK